MSMIDTTDVERKIASRIDERVAANMELRTGHTGGLAFANMSEVMNFARTMAIAQIAIPKHLRNNPGACLGVCIQAVEWEMSPFAVANKSYSVNDRLAYEAQLIAAVILRRAPIRGRFKVEYSGNGDARVCRVWANLRDENESVEYVSPPFGKITPKNSPLWKSDPDQQQFYYSSRALCRRHFPDVLLGVYAVDEIEEAQPPRGPSLARDVTSRTLSDRLDALAAPPHDPETGEIVERADKDISEDRPADESASAANEAPARAQAATGAEVATSSPATSAPKPTPEHLAEGDDAAVRGTISLTAFLGRFKGKAPDRFGADVIESWRRTARDVDAQIAAEEGVG